MISLGISWDLFLSYLSLIVRFLCVPHLIFSSSFCPSSLLHPSFSVFLSLCLCLIFSVCLSVYVLSISLSLSLSLSVSVSLSFSFLLSPYLSVSLSLCVSLSLFSLWFFPFHFFLSFFLFVFLSPSPVSPLSAIFLFAPYFYSLSSFFPSLSSVSLSLYSLSLSLFSLSILSLSLLSLSLLSLSLYSLSLSLSVCLSVFPYLPFLSLFLSCFAFRSRNSLNHSNVTQFQETTLSTIVSTLGGHDVGINDDEIDSSGNLVPV